MAGGLSTPDITPAQVVAVVGSVGAELLDAALISGRLEQLLVGVAGIVVPFAWLLADAIIRHGRAHAAVLRPSLPPSVYRQNSDGSWTRSSDGAVGSFGPSGFVPAA